MGDRTVFVLGAPRSGTSLVYRTLCLHPDVAWLSNWVRRAPSVPQLSVLNRAASRFASRRRRAWFGAGGDDAYQYGRSRPLSVRLFPTPVEGEPSYRACGVGDDPSASSPDAPTNLRNYFDVVRRWSGARVMASKRIANNRRIAVLDAAFPDAMFVVVTRDGRAVARSLSRVDWWRDTRLWWAGATPERCGAAGDDPWTLCARHWVEEVRAIDDGLSGVAPSRVVRLTYEDLVAAPYDVLGDVAGRVGLSVTHAWTSELAALAFPDRNDAWRDDLDAEAIATIERVQAATLAANGYRA